MDTDSAPLFHFPHHCGIGDLRFSSISHSHWLILTILGKMTKAKWTAENWTELFSFLLSIGLNADKRINPIYFRSDLAEIQIWINLEILNQILAWWCLRSLGALDYSHIHLDEPLAGRNEMCRQLIGKIKAVQFDANQMHRKCKLISVEHAVLVQVRQLPDFAKNCVRKSWFHELRLGYTSADLAIDWTKCVKYLIVFVAISWDDPLVGVVTSSVHSFTFADPKRAFIVAVKRTTLQTTINVDIRSTSHHITAEQL